MLSAQATRSHTQGFVAVKSIWVGFDPREAAAYAVARHSINKRLTQQIPVNGVILGDLKERGLYTRPMEMRRSAADHPIMWDVLSDAPMSTQHANARFLVPHLAKHGWALFLDGDVLVRGNLARVFEGLDAEKAVYCVKHQHAVSDALKMDGQIQTNYARKNWSSFCIWNVGHEANAALTNDAINTWPGRDLHAFKWLADEQIGELGPEWNFLVGYSDPSIDPKVVHFTSGTPDMPGYSDVPYADEWRAELTRWAA
jgi:lipopolysaccharide biosynthesis glycosyltransferase